MERWSSEKWEQYKAQWESEHPDDKPEKTRFQIMCEFMKEKYENETEEMKERCEEYRKSKKDESPAPAESVQNWYTDSLGSVGVVYCLSWRRRKMVMP